MRRAMGAGLRKRVSAFARPFYGITKKRLGGAMLWLCWALLLCAAFSNANRLAAVYPAISLRYNTPISHAAATNARKTAAAEGGAASFWPTFWAEQEGIAVQGLHETSARCIWFSGDAALVWPADFLRGGAPGPLDRAGCCISGGLAWQLWGTMDVTGNEMTISGQSYTVRGVFRESDLLVLAGVGEAAFAGGWQAAELAGTPDGDARAAALAFAQACGLGQPATLVDGPAAASLAGFMAALPAAATGLALLILLLRRLAKALPGKGWGMAFAALLLFALVLPALLELLPPALSPTRFSDFGFWGRLAQAQWEHLEEWLLLRPYYVDLQAKLLLGAQAVIFVAQGIVCVVLLRSLPSTRGFAPRKEGVIGSPVS